MKSTYVKPVMEQLPLYIDSPILADSGAKIGDLTNKNNDGSSTSSGGFGTDNPTFDNQGGGFQPTTPAKPGNVWDDVEY